MVRSENSDPENIRYLQIVQSISLTKCNVNINSGNDLSLVITSSHLAC